MHFIISRSMQEPNKTMCFRIIRQTAVQFGSENCQNHPDCVEINSACLKTQFKYKTLLC